MGTDKVNLTSTNKKIQEWRHRIGYVSAHLVKKTFEAYTKDYPGVRHERKVIMNKSALVTFPSLLDTLRGIHRNKEIYLVDVMEFNHAGKKCRGLVFYGVKSQLLAYYRLR